MKGLQRYLDVVIIGVITACSSLPWLWVISGIRAWASLVVVIAAGTALASVSFTTGFARHLSTWWVHLILLFAVLDVITIDQPWNVVQIVNGLSSGLAHLSTSVLPASSPGDLLVSPIVVVALVAWLAAKFEKKQQGSPWSVAPWIINFALATAFGATFNGSNASLGIFFAASLLIWLSWRHRRLRSYVEVDPDSTVWNQVFAVGTPVIIFSLLMGGVVFGQARIPQLNGNAVSVTRKAPDTSLNGSNPSAILATLRYSAKSETPLFHVSLSGLGSNPSMVTTTTRTGKAYLLPIATLSNYNGSSWYLGNLQPVNAGNAVSLVTFSNAGNGPSGSHASSVHVEVLNGAVTNLLNRYLPTPGGVISGVAGTDVAADPETGFGVSSSALGAGQTIDVSGVSSARDPGISSLSNWAPSIRVCQQLMIYIGLKPTSSTSCSFEPLAGGASPLSLINKQVSLLKSTEGVAPIGKQPQQAATDVTGQSFGDILTTVLGSNAEGTPEQYATLVAMLGRVANLPSRVVTGFAVPTSPAGRTVSLTPAMSYTWAEIYDGGRWQVEDATPMRIGHGKALTSALAQQQTDQNSGKSNKCTLNCTPIVHHFYKGHPANPYLRLLMEIGIGIAGLVALVVVWIAAIAGIKSRRRHRRATGSPRQRIRGAIAELIDLRRELTRGPRLDSSSTSEIVDIVIRETQDENDGESTSIVNIVNLALYGVGDLGELPADDVWRWVSHRKADYWSRVGRLARFKSRLFFVRSAY